MKYNTHAVGQKIRYFRKRAGLSQLDLELEIEAAQGSLSRIENGEVNPTKETILKIIEKLNIKGVEAISLLGLKTLNLAKIIEVSRKFSNNLNIDQVLQNSVNEIAYELNLLAAAIFIIENNEVYSKTFTQTWFSELIYKLFPNSFNKIHAPLVPTSKNMIVRTIIENKSFYIKDFRSCTIDAFSKKISSIFEQIIGFKSGITYPLIINKKTIGAMLYVKNYEDDFYIEKPVLKAFTDHIAVAIDNAQKYQELQNELKKLK